MPKNLIYKHNIDIQPYKGENKLIKSLRKLISEGYEEIFKCVVVHGSISTDEIINYSDFDGLLIVHNEYKNSKILKDFINESMLYIYDFDPLQHHGWFILFSQDLENYPQIHFPNEIIKDSKLIFPDKKISIKINVKNIPDYKSRFYTFSGNLEKKIHAHYPSKNIYQLKSLLSEIMLLPALYAQAKKNYGVSKKESFLIAKNDFTEDLWKPIIISSEIRNT